MSARTTEFIAHYRKYMEPTGSSSALFEFIDVLRFDDARDCTLAYFDLDKEYLHARPKARVVFLKLALRSLDQGDVYFALRIEIWIATHGTPWQKHYEELQGKERASLDKQIARRKGSLSPVQRWFIEKFDRYMHRKATQQQIEAGLSKYKQYEPWWECLQAYVEVSQAYKQSNERESLLIFLGLSRGTLWRAAANITHTYESYINGARVVWQERFQALKTYEQEAIRKDIKDRKTIREDIVYKDKTYKNIPTGTYQFDPVAPEKDRKDESQGEPGLNKIQQEFVRLFLQFMRQGDRKAMNELQGWLEKRNAKERQDCVQAYLKAADKHYPTDTDRSRSIFFGVVAMALARGGAYYAFKVDSWSQAAGTTFGRRFAGLTPTDQGRLKERIRDELRRARVIDDVKAAYYAKHQKDPDEKALRTFEPTSNAEQENLLSNALSSCEVAVNVSNENSGDNFAKAFDVFSAVMRAQKDPLTMVLLLKRCRERHALQTTFRHLFYLYGVGLLYMMALRGRPVVYKNGFDEEEARWLMDAIEGRNRYYDDFAVQLAYVIQKRMGEPKLTEMCKAEGLLHVYAERFRLQLTPTLEAAGLRGMVEELWRTKGDAVRAIRIPIQSSRDGTKILRVGQTIGKFYILWWDAYHGTAYLLVEGFDQVVFETRGTRLAAIYDDDAIYGEIARRTSHLLVLIPLLFEILSYLPDLVSGGLTGLIKGIVLDYAFDKSMQALGIDPTKAQLAMFGARLLAAGRRPPKADAVDPPAIQAPGIGRNTDISSPQHRAIDTPSTTSAAAGKNTASLTDPPLASRTGIDMRGDMTPDGYTRTRGADVDPTPSSNNASRATDSTAVDPRDRTGGRTLVDNKDGRRSRDGGKDVDDTREATTKKPRPADKGGNKRDAQHEGDAKDPPKKSSSRQQQQPPPPPPPSPPPSNIRNQITTGTWRRDGDLEINEGGFGFAFPTNVKRPPDLTTNWRKYEEGFNSQIVVAMAQRVSNKPVRFDMPSQRGFTDQPGHRTPSSAKTNRMKYQKGRERAMLTRRPEGTMEVVEGVGKAQKVTEVHFFEATLQRHFVPSVGKPGHKQRQIAGTTWISGERKGYTPDTQLHYHITSPGPPTPETTAFLNQLMHEVPNLRVNWYIVR